MGGAVAVTFFVTLIFTAAITAAIVIVIAYFLHRNKSNSSYEKSVPRNNGSSNEKPHVPPRPRKV